MNSHNNALKLVPERPRHEHARAGMLWRGGFCNFLMFKALDAVFDDGHFKHEFARLLCLQTLQI